MPSFFLGISLFSEYTVILINCCVFKYLYFLQQLAFCDTTEMLEHTGKEKSAQNNAVLLNTTIKNVVLALFHNIVLIKNIFGRENKLQ